VTPLLFLAHRIPYPPDKGDKIRSFHVLRHLASRFDVHLGCFSGGRDNHRHLEVLRDLCAGVFCLPLARGKFAKGMLQALARKQSLSEAVYHDSGMTRWVEETLRRHEIRHIFVFCSAMAPYVLGHGYGRRVVVDMVDVDSRKWGEYAGSANPFLRPLFRLEQRRVLALEKRAANASDRILFVSKAEAAGFAALAPELAKRIDSMTNGVDFGYFDPHDVQKNPFAADALPIVFTGAMDYRANVDAVRWFAQECFPTIRETHRSAEFWIVGANPTRAVRHLSRADGVRVTGTVTDTRPYLAHAACAVAPLRIARGVQNKVLEAMAMAKPAVVTRAGLEGIEALSGREVLVADTAPEIALCVSEVLSGRWNGLGQAARAFVRRNHRWPETLKVLDEAIPDIRLSHQAPRGQEIAMLPTGTA
jgi:sugar transferase (PEP-CTERM/EpsH1 system associated)